MTAPGDEKVIRPKFKAKPVELSGGPYDYAQAFLDARHDHKEGRTLHFYRGAFHAWTGAAVPLQARRPLNRAGEASRPDSTLAIRLPQSLFSAQPTLRPLIEIAVDFGMAGQDELGCPGRVRPFVQKVQRRGEAPVAERMTQRTPLGFEILEIRQPFQVGAEPALDFKPELAFAAREPALALVPERPVGRSVPPWLVFDPCLRRHAVDMDARV